MYGVFRPIYSEWRRRTNLRSRHLILVANSFLHVVCIRGRNAVAPCPLSTARRLRWGFSEKRCDRFEKHIYGIYSVAPVWLIQSIWNLLCISHGYIVFRTLGARILWQPRLERAAPTPPVHLSAAEVAHCPVGPCGPLSLQLEHSGSRPCPMVGSLERAVWWELEPPDVVQSGAGLWWGLVELCNPTAALSFKLIRGYSQLDSSSSHPTGHARVLFRNTAVVCSRGSRPSGSEPCNFSARGPRWICVTTTTTLSAAPGPPLFLFSALWSVRQHDPWWPPFPCWV